MLACHSAIPVHGKPPRAEHAARNLDAPHILRERQAGDLDLEVVMAAVQCPRDIRPQRTEVVGFAIVPAACIHRDDAAVCATEALRQQAPQRQIGAFGGQIP